MKRLAAGIAFALVLPLGPQAPHGTAVDPFAFFAPTVTVSGDERRQLDRGEPVERVVPAPGEEVAVFAAVPVRADGERLLRWMRAIAALKKSPFVLQIGRFSDPPRLSDLDALTLEDEDLEAVRHCRPDDCSVKLSAAEMAGLQRAIGAAGSAWRATAQQAFRDLVFARVRAYLAGGQAALARYADDDGTPPLDAAFAAILQHTPFLPERAPRVTACLQAAPCATAPPVETFVYWSKEQFGGRPVISATHVVMASGAAAGGLEALVAGKQIFATHYMNGSLGLTALARDGDRRYLAYLNRSNVDLLGGMWGRFVRLILQRRLASEAPEILKGLSRRVESGDPPHVP